MSNNEKSENISSEKQLDKPVVIESKDSKETVELQLGDIIQLFVFSPDTGFEMNKNDYERLNEQTFMIDYIDSKKNDNYQ